MSGQQTPRYFKVLTNDTSDLGIWPVGRKPPEGWRLTAFAGNLEACEGQVTHLARRRTEPASGQTGDAEAAPAPLPAHFRFTAQAHPEAVAAVAGGFRLTYRDLSARVDELTGKLLGAGLRRGEEVVLPHGTRNPDMVVVLLATLAAGGVCVLPGRLSGSAMPDPTFLLSRPAVILIPESTNGDAGQQLSDRGTWQGVTGERWRIAGTPDLATRPPAVGPARPAAHDPALVLFSGIIGRGTGLVWRHHQLPPLAGSSGLPWVGPDDRLVLWRSADSTMLVLDVLRSVLAGATLVFPPDRPAPGGDGAVISTLTGSATPVADGGFIRLRTSVTRPDGSRELTEALALPETGIVALGEPSGRRLTPAPPANLYLLDEELSPVAEGEVGRLHVGGPAVATGYLDRPDLTMRRFLPDPMGEAGSRMFRTRTLARRLPTGQLEPVVPGRSTLIG